MYDEKLALAILVELDKAFPRKLQMDDLARALADFPSATQEKHLLLAMDALIKRGRAKGVELRAGYNDALRMVANIEITQQGREFLMESSRAPGREDGDVDDLLPIFSKRQFQDDFRAQSTIANSSAPIGLLFVDLDHFKTVNDSFGHPIGDEVLIKTAQTLKAACNKKGTCYRWGGDEFVVLLQNYSLDEAAVLAERLRKAISETVFTGYPNRVTASIGVATYPETVADAADLENVADAALLAAKKAGRNQVCLASRWAEGRLASGAIGARLSAAEITKRIEAARPTAKIASGVAANFLIEVHNDSGDEIVVTGIELLSEDDVRLTGIGRPPQENLWRVPPHTTRPVAWRAEPDPAVQLAKMNSHRGAVFQTKIRVLLAFEILGGSRDYECTMTVRVDAVQRKIIYLAG